MKIIERIPHEPYAYTEVEFESIAEYEEVMPTLLAKIRVARAKAQKKASEVLKVNTPF